MTTLSHVIHRAERLGVQLRPSPKYAVGFVESDGYVYPHKNKFDDPAKTREHYTPEEFEAKMKAEGYDEIILISFNLGGPET